MTQKVIRSIPLHEMTLREAARIAQINRRRLEEIYAAQQSRLMLAEAIETDNAWRNDATGYSYGK
jgi:hypothetical protein